MKQSVLQSFRFQMFANILGVLLLLIFSAAYILYSTVRLQELVSTSFDQQRNIRNVQEELNDFQKPFLEYLSTKSSNALSELLIKSQKIRTMIPSYAVIPSDPVTLREKEVYSLVSSWLDFADRAVEEKRSMDIEQYTKLYSEMQTLFDYINTEIENISTLRFSAQYADYEVFISTSRNIQFWNLLFMIFISFFSITLIFRAVEKISRPMVRLSQTAAEISAGKFDAEDVTMTSLNEVDQVVSAFNRMKRDIHTSIEELKWQRNVEKEYMQERVKNMKMQEMIRRMELYTLQAQMNPHFLFNTLNTGIQLAIVEGADRTCEYMDHLAKLFRHNIRANDVLVPLRHEIEGLESYFYILGVRFPKNLDLVLDCPAELLDAYTVPAYILQPLVENCVVHAFKETDGRNSIIVRAYIEGPRLILSVADNGVGMKAELVASLLKQVPADESKSKVMGLENVIQRLYFFFPDVPDVVTIKSAEGQGTEILVSIDTGEKPMYSVLIVDDEEPVLDSFSFILESGVDGFMLGGKARSGFEAIKLMYELKPDVVFMDISMPGIDGLDTISEVHEKFPDTLFILSTAYERFDLARRAIPLGVFAYLVKPVTKNTFCSTLASAREVLQKRRSSKTDVQSNLTIRQFLKEDVWKELDAAKWQSVRENLDLDSDRGLVAFIGADSDLDAIFNGINAQLGYRYRFHFIMNLGLGMYFFPGDINRDELSLAIAEILESQVPAGTVSMFGTGSVRGWQELYLSCGEALDEINRKRDYTDLRLRERMRIIMIRRKIGLSPFDEVSALFTAYREEVFASYPFPLAKAKMVALFTLLVDDCTGCYESHTAELPPFSPPDEISPLVDLPAWNDWAVSSFSRMYQCAHQTRTGKFPVPLVKALSFIEENFEKQIQLSDAANASSVSSAYLSRLFGEHMDSSFIDYLTVMRVERAEKLIRENRMNIKEVSFAVGYQDPNYFSKIFRKVVGISPSMYAERNRNES